jgi:hypothetical protein
MQYFAAFGGEEKVIEDLRQNRRERWLEGGFGSWREASAEPKLTEKAEPELAEKAEPELTLKEETEFRKLNTK